MPLLDETGLAYICATAERFYAAPLVWNASCAGSTLSFTAADAFKRPNKYAATYDVVERPARRAKSVAGDFELAAYWRDLSTATLTFFFVPVDRSYTKRRSWSVRHGGSRSSACLLYTSPSPRDRG